MERRLAAILAADVVGFTRLMGADETGTLARLKSLRGEVIDPEITRHNGRIVKLMGDGALVEFASVVDAVACAAAIQRHNATRDADLTEAERLTLRIGVNLGDVIVEGEDIYGDGVNIAARLEALAEPGGICISDIVHQSVKAKLDLGFDDLGPQQVKNVAEPVRVYRVRLAPCDAGTVAPVKRGWRRPAIAAAVVALVLMAGLAAWQRPWEPREEPASVERMAFPLPDKPSIAVLPFVNMSDDPGQEFFADGMTEDLITDLSKVSDLFVISRTSTFVYKGRSVPVKQVSEDLGVRYVLEGSVRRAGDTVRINAQLIDATTGGHLWAERYDGNVTDIFAVQDSFVRKIVGALALNLSEDEQNEIASGQTSNIEAREAYQNGWEHYLRYTPEDNAAAADQFKRAVELDPEYGRAYSALGMVYVRGCQWRWNEELGMSAGGAFATAVNFLSKGEENSSSMTKVAASQIFLYDGKHDKAFTEAARAVGQDPNDPEAQVVMGLAMITTGRPEAGLEFVEAALRLNPNHPSHYVLAHAMAYFSMNDMEQTAAVLSAALERDPSARGLAPMLAASYARLGQREEARAALRLWKPDASPAELEELVFSYHFPYKWSGNRVIPARLAGGLEVAALPSNVTVESLLLTLRQTEDEFERRTAIRSIGQFGPAAKAAVPVLQELLDDPKSKFMAQHALKMINGK